MCQTCIVNAVRSRAMASPSGDDPSRTLSSRRRGPSVGGGLLRPGSRLSGARQVPVGLPLEDEVPAGLVIGRVGPKEIDPHLFQLVGAIVREGLDVFVVETPLVLLPKHQAEFRILAEALRPLPQLGLERVGILAEDVVEK